ncbi:MAG: OmpA family protein [Alphaproteobacteria bacterium]
MSRPILALLAFLVFIVGGILGWVTRDSDFGANLVSGNGGEDSGFVQVSAPEQAQLVSVMAALDVPATPQSGLSGDNLVNISAALSALQERSNQVAEAFAERDKAVEEARQEAQATFEQKEADLTALLAVERKDLLDLVGALEGDVEAREAEIAAEQQAAAETQQKYDEILGEVTALQLERDALAAEKSRLSDLVSVAEERLAAIGDLDSVALIINQRELATALEDAKAEKAVLQQQLSDLLAQIDAAKGELDDLASEQQSGQRLLEAVRLEGQRLLARQEEAELALEPAENAVFAAQTEAESLRIEAAALRSEIAAKIEEREIIIAAIGTFGATVADSGQVLINGDPITPESAVATLQRTLVREQEAREKLVETQTQLENLAQERASLDSTVEDQAEQRAAVLAAEAKARIAEAEAEVAAMQAELLTEASDRERALEQELAQLEADMNAQIAEEVALRVSEALAVSLNTTEAALNTQAEARAQAQFEAEKARLIADIQAEANDRIEAQRATLINRFNEQVESRAAELARELAERLIGDNQLQVALNNASTGGELVVDQSAAMAEIRERLYTRLVTATSTEFGYVPRVVGERLLLASNGLFPVGSPNLSREGQDELQIFGQQLERILSDLDNDEFMIRVDGHADIKPYLFSPYGNWELSSERAVSVVEYLIENTSIPANRLMVAAFGEHQPLVEGDDEAAQQQNRRIEFKLVRR